MNYLFLDFDSVVNIIPPIWKAEHDKHDIIYTTINPYQIIYDKSVVKWINDKNNDDNVQLFWLTSWHGNTDKFVELGLEKDIASLGPSYDVSPINHFGAAYKWKRRFGIEKTKEIHDTDPDARIVWVDDEKIVNGHINNDNVYTINTIENCGLASYHLRNIDNFFATGKKMRNNV